MSGNTSDRPARKALANMAAVASGYGALTLWLVARTLPYRPDDAEILWRYAQNLAQGNGWSFNPGEAINACTSPLYVMLHGGALWVWTVLLGDGTGGERLGLPHPEIAAGIWGLAMLGAVLGLYRLLLHLKAHPLIAFGTGALLLLSPLQRSTLGMECQLQLALVVWTWIAWLRRWRCTGVLMGLLVLARPDGVLFALLLAGSRAVGPKRESIGSLLRWLAPGALLVGLPFAVWATIRFGWPLPSTLAAKQAQGESGFWVARWFFRDAKRSLGDFDTWGVVLSYKPFLVVWILGALSLWKARALTAAFAYAAFHLLAYQFLGVPFYHWYANPLHFALVLAPAAVHLAGRSMQLRWLSPIGGLLLAALLLSVAHVPQRQILYQGYRDAAAWIQAKTPDDTRIACAEIGVLGLNCHPRPIVDLCGLATPDAVPHIRTRNYAWLLEASRPDDALPDAFVFHNPPWGGLEQDLTDHPRFQAHYQLAFSSPNEPVQVWVRGR